MYLHKMFANYQRQIINTSFARINAVKIGEGLPILLLHGYPQTHLMWHKIAPNLAKDFTIIATDLRGYGDSSKPAGESDHSNYSKRAMAQDQVEVMSYFGYESFYLVGHDRGARVAQRLTLDYPEKVKKLVLLDILPTLDLYESADREFASSYYHWFFLIQAYPLPETLIGSNAEFFLRNCLQNWSQDFSGFSEEVLREYIRCFTLRETIHATCEDYRAGFTIDLIHDRLDLEKKITCPLLVLWGNKGIIGRKYDVLNTWQKKAINLTGKSLNCGHFLPEEAPQETYQLVKEFLIDRIL